MKGYVQGFEHSWFTVTIHLRIHKNLKMSSHALFCKHYSPVAEKCSLLYLSNLYANRGPLGIKVLQTFLEIFYSLLEVIEALLF